jgi:hypothetical protein
MDGVITQMESLQRRLEALQGRVSHRETQADSRRGLQVNSYMRTIAILGLLFVPTQTVSSVLATPVFDFQNWRKDSESSMKPVGLAYGLACGMVTATAIVICVVFYWRDQSRWGLENRNEVDKETKDSGHGTDPSVGDGVEVTKKSASSTIFELEGIDAC